MTKRLSAVLLMHVSVTIPEQDKAREVNTATFSKGKMSTAGRIYLRSCNIVGDCKERRERS